MAQTETAYFAGGCFWCITPAFRELAGVFDVISGYSGGTEENPTYEELKVWQAKSGLPLKRFFNTSGLLYKSLNLKERLPEMTEEEQLRLLASDGMLVKRPILVTEERILVGFREAEWTEVTEC